MRKSKENNFFRPLVAPMRRYEMTLLDVLKTLKTTEFSGDSIDCNYVDVVDLYFFFFNFSMN